VEGCGELGNRLLNRKRHLCHSGNEKFRSDLNRPESCKMSERLLKTLRKFADFQAEYEVSIPVTRLNVFCALLPAPDFIPTNAAAFDDLF